MTRLILTKREVYESLRVQDCNHCGACCRGYSIELQETDIIRQPILLQHSTPWKDLPPERRKSFSKAPWVMDLNSKPCPFLTTDSTCRIYDTRPGICRNFQPTRLNCHMSRLEERGLDIKGFMEISGIIYNADPQITIGIIFSIDPARIDPIGPMRGVNPVRKSVRDLVDIEYFERFKRTMLRS